MNRKIFIAITFSFVFALTGCGGRKHERQGTVSVSGTGTVQAPPDMIQMTVSFSHVAPTTKIAKKEVEDRMQQIFKILHDENVDEKHIKTVSLRYNIETGYRNGRWVTIGQRAEQTISVKITDIMNKPERFPALLDRITAIDRVEISNIQFDIENKAEFFRQSRELAYQKALDKANQYADLSKRRIGKVLTISEKESRDNIMFGRTLMNNVRVMEQAAADEYSVSSSVPSGEREITSEINVTFLLE